jgi:hypothetical protein
MNYLAAILVGIAIAVIPALLLVVLAFLFT